MSNGVKVPRLNADRLDGLTAGDFARSAGRTGVRTVDGEWAVGQTPNGCGDPGTGDCTPMGYVFAAPRCPKGTLMTGGGFSGLPSTGRLIESRPDGNGWKVQVAVAAADAPSTTPSSLKGYVTCYNPRGVVK